MIWPECQDESPCIQIPNSRICLTLSFQLGMMPDNLLNLPFGSNFPMCALHSNSAGVNLRHAAPQDEAFLRTVYASTRTEELALTDWSDRQKDAFVRMQFEAQRRSYAADSPNAEYWVIQCDGVDVGRLITNRTDTQISLMDVAVLPEFRNRRIGSRIMAELLEEASQTGKTVRLYVERFNPALQWYQRLGFRTVSENGVYYQMIWSAGEHQTLVGADARQSSGNGTDQYTV
jgi:ribosomal protein S18 acetylase RimI-like enzyme